MLGQPGQQGSGAGLELARSLPGSPIWVKLHLHGAVQSCVVLCEAMQCCMALRELCSALQGCTLWCCSEVLCSPAQLCSEVLNGAVRHPTQLYGTGQCYMELYSAAWGCMVLCSAVQWTVLHYLQCHTTVVGCCGMLYSAAQCCTVLQDISQCYTRWYSAVNVQCCATYSATQSCTQCCRMLYSVTGHFTMLHKVVQCCKCTLLRYLQCYTTL